MIHVFCLFLRWLMGSMGQVGECWTLIGPRGEQLISINRRTVNCQNNRSAGNPYKRPCDGHGKIHENFENFQSLVPGHTFLKNNNTPSEWICECPEKSKFTEHGVQNSCKTEQWLEVFNDSFASAFMNSIVSYCFYVTSC